MATVRTTTSLLRQTLATAPRRVGLATPRHAALGSFPSRAYSSTSGDSSSTSSGSGKSSSNTLVLTAVALGAAGVAAYATFGDDLKSKASSKVLSKGADFVPTQQDYQKVYNAIAADLEKDPEYDDGSFGPVLVRLAWHASGTYCAKTGTGGSNGATMRFAPEADHGANAGLLAARNFMESIKKKFPWISYSDLWTLGGVVAVQELGGPTIPWRAGRSDREEQHCTPDGRLPDGDKGAPHIRDIFYRMGFNDQEIVALSGAHALGRCHPDRSGFDGPWQHSPISFNNAYFDLLLNDKWQFRKWNGPKQYQDKSTGKLMMLPTDMALIQDKSFRKFVEKYAQSEDAFFGDFSKAFSKLLELGVPKENFEKSITKGEPVTFKTTAEQDL